MAHQPRRRTCQGNFAASVKAILPIDEYNDLAASSYSKQISRNIAEEQRRLYLDRLTSCGVISFTGIQCLGDPHAPPPRLQSRIIASASALNPHPQRVADPVFLRGEFFDPRTWVQVKYEMLRAFAWRGPPSPRSFLRSGSHAPFSIRPKRLPKRRLARLDPSTPGPPRPPQTLGPNRGIPAPAPTPRPALARPRSRSWFERSSTWSSIPGASKRALERRRKKVP